MDIHPKKRSLLKSMFRRLVSLLYSAVVASPMPQCRVIWLAIESLWIIKGVLYNLVIINDNSNSNSKSNNNNKTIINRTCVVGLTNFYKDRNNYKEMFRQISMMFGKTFLHRAQFSLLVFKNVGIDGTLFLNLIFFEICTVWW